MNQEALAVDRSVASAINPLIGSLWTEDTLAAVSSVVYELGFMVAETELAKENTFRIFEAAAAALWWECENIHSCRLARLAKEESHV